MMLTEEILDGLENPVTPTSIRDFFDGQTIFLTGGGGFMGKVLIEKLLWSCEGIERIFVLLRSKKGQSSDERIANIIKAPLFDRLRQRDSNVFNKITPIEGDISKSNLGLSEDDRKILEESVSIVFHAAADTRFDSCLKHLILTNARGTCDILNLSTNMRNLKVVMYVSTLFSTVDRHTSEEKIYESDIHWRDLLKVAEIHDEYTLKILTKKLIENHMNSYTYTKLIAENIVNEYSNIIPCVIYRPCIIMPNAREPFPGWIDNTIGFVVVALGIFFGIIHVVNSEKNSSYDVLPCDYAINGIIIHAWYAGVKRGKKCIVSNGINKGLYRLCLQDLLDGINLENASILPSKYVMWYPSIVLTTNKFLFNIIFLLTQIIPGLLLDVIVRKKVANKSVMQINRRMYAFLKDHPNFYSGMMCENANYKDIIRNLSEEEAEIFKCGMDDCEKIDYITNLLCGVTNFVLNKLENGKVAEENSQLKIKM